MNRLAIPAFTIALTITLTLTACGSSKSSSASNPSSTSTQNSSTTAPRTGAGPLTGLFKLDAAQCTSSAPPGGSYFRMVQSGGTPAAGPFVPNADSTCTNKTFSALTPGTDGGLKTGVYQPQPVPPFDAAHNGVANKITEPTKFFGAGFAVSTNPKDPQTGTATPVPTIEADASGRLSGNVSAFGVAWNGQQFNQGAPKPNGTSSGGTRAVHGTYNAATGAFVVEWSSQIVGGPFNGFTGIWHLVGTFTTG